MANLYCSRCEGEGTVSALFVNHLQRFFRRRIICCSLCNNRHDELWDEVRSQVEMAPKGVTVPSLIQQGYRDICEKKEDFPRVQNSKFSVGS